MNRRVFLAAWVALVGIGRRAWAQVAGDPIRYAPLTRPVSIPLEDVTTPWRPVAFTAEGTAPATPRRRVLISGVLFRRDSGTAAGTSGSIEHLSALCVTCPHEQCQVDFVTDESQLARIRGGTPAQPLFECGCHASVFDAAADGARIAGETPRGLYRFRIAGVSQGMVEITEIEEVALSEV